MRVTTSPRQQQLCRADLPDGQDRAAERHARAPGAVQAAGARVCVFHLVVRLHQHNHHLLGRLQHISRTDERNEERKDHVLHNSLPILHRHLKKVPCCSCLLLCTS